MEIISYVGFDNRDCSRPLENAVNRLTAVFRRSGGQGGKAFRSAGQDFLAAAEPQARWKTIAAKAHASFCSKTALIQADAYHFILKNRLMILKAFCAAAVTLVTATFVAKHIDYAPRLSSPLLLDKSGAGDIEKLNSIMALFALEETQLYTADGTLVGEEPSVPLQTLFSQPVTFRTYKVQNGDTISGITKKFGLKNISTLIAVNDIDNVRQLAAGQKLKIPSVDGLFHTVKNGDSLTALSAKYNVTM